MQVSESVGVSNAASVGLLQDWLTLHLWDEVPLEGCRCAQEVPSRVQA